MKKNKRIKYILILVGFIFLILIALKLFFKKDHNLKLVLSTQLQNKKIEVYQDTTIQKQELVLFTQYKNKKSVLGSYDLEGGERKTFLNDIFIYKDDISQDEYLVVIVAEDVSRPLIELSGTSYRIYMYDDNLTLIDFSASFGGGIGFEGTAEGENIEFEFKDKDGFVSKNYLNKKPE